jgi:hypothetical protein
MDITLKKIELIEWLTKIDDETLINRISALKKDSEKDWWDSLSNEQREDIEAGLGDIESGRKTEFNKVLSKYR